MITTSVCEVVQFSTESLSCYEKDQAALISLLEQKGWTDIAIWGAGRNGRYLCSLLADSSIRVNCVFDNHCRGHVGPYNIYPANEAGSKLLLERPLILAINRAAEGVNELVNRLNELGVTFFVFEAASNVATIGENNEPFEEKKPARMSLEGSLMHLRDKGFYPQTVIDVGAAFGHWSSQVGKVFPLAKYVLIEPLKLEFEPFLSRFQANSSLNCEILYAAASDENGVALFNVHEDWTSSSLMKEAEGSFVDGVEREVKTQKLADMVTNSAPPYLLKIDTQGNELKVIAGCEDILSGCDVIILEVSFFPFFNTGPSFVDVVNAMKNLGYVVYDVITLHYKLLDNSLAQADVIFTREESSLRLCVDFATKEQRKNKIESFQASVNSMTR